MAPLLVLFLVLLPSVLEAAPASVRLAEGNVRGLLVLRDHDDHAIAYGELRQKPRGHLIESRLVLNFEDGSLYDETVTFSQDRVFKLQAYRLIQRGPSFPTTDVSFDRQSGHYQARTQEKKGSEEKTASGPLEIPDDLYNGMALVVLKNLGRGSVAHVHMAAFTPKPRIIQMTVTEEGADTARLGPHAEKVLRYLVKLEIGGATGLVARLIGKTPPDLRYWVVPGDVPAFAKFEGAMFLNGPVWRLEPTTVQWPKAAGGR